MSLPEMKSSQETASGKPIILLVTRRLDPADPESRWALDQLGSRFDIRLVKSPTQALEMSRIVKANKGRVALLLSDVLRKGSDVLHFISEFNHECPEAGIHLFDAVEGRVIFTEPQPHDSDKAAEIHIEANGREYLDAQLLLKMVNRHFPEGTRL